MTNPGPDYPAPASMPAQENLFPFKTDLNNPISTEIQILGIISDSLKLILELAPLPSNSGSQLGS